MIPVCKKRPHRAWSILAGCILLQAGGTGILGNCRSIFFSSITSELGLGNGAMSLYSTILAIAIALSMSAVSGLYGRIDLRLLLTGMALLGTGCFALQSQFTAIWQWYVMAPFFGLACGGLMTIPATIIINNWFHDRAGLALGLSLSASGIAGAICNPVCTALIEQLGWRAAVVVTAGISLALLLPATAVLLRLQPSDVGCAPYGEPGGSAGHGGTSGRNDSIKPCGATATASAAESSAEAAATMKTIVPHPSPGREEDNIAAAVKGLADRPYVFVFLLAIVLVFSSGIELLYQISLYCSQEGIALTVAGTLTCLVMLGNTGGKFLLGVVNDRRGPWFTIGGGCLFVLLALLGYASCVPTVMYLSSPFLGLAYGLLSMAPSLFCKQIYGANYQSRYRLIMTLSNLGSAAFASLLGYLSDFLGSYRPLYVAMAVGFALAGMIIALLSCLEKRSAAAA